ncbi:hypothetical protein BCB4_0025 [Bacillus phage B4]|uniref:Uncharacterized protein n=2 Tax=Bequatrovirus B4 TaxID=1918005 RepID=J9PRD0_9CAUD|nr:hypothetical protein BCB4_0025 [Bacillus phage B4]YP_009783621.1 hypothetical protein QLX26_gp025 [Bacillus phage B5S]AEW47259.1 hypothetical protein B5S_0025 [Bacillus phage B5S]AEZ65818.1 hypothetical protein BCB4_0025 [Bacillus phage B4]
MSHRPFIDFEVGQRVVTTEKIVNGLIEVEPLTEGVIVYHSNQVEATVWFRSLSPKAESAINKELKTNRYFGFNGQVDGITLRVSRQSLAHKLCWGSDMYYIAVDKRALVDLPLFNGLGLPEIDTRWYNGSEKYKAHVVRDIITVIDDKFVGWVEKELELRPISPEEREDEDYPDDWTFVYTDESMDKYYEKKDEIELAFSKATGLYIEFTGGMIFND